MSQFNRVGGRYGMHSGSAKFKNLQVDQNAWVAGNSLLVSPGSTLFVDGDVNSSGSGDSWDTAFKTIQEAVTASNAEDTIYVVARTSTDYSDPISYVETIIIPYASSNLAIIGVSRGRTQGGLPQIKIGSGSTALLTIRAPGCLIANMGFNGYGSTGGGILLDDDNSAKSAFGTSIIGCHLKNCKGHATDGRLGGGVMWSAEGNAWQVLIEGCRFYKNLGDIVLLGTTNSRPQDVVIQDCNFTGMAADTDVNIYGANGGFGSININNCQFGQLPAIGSGSVVRYIDLTGTLNGIISNCTFGCQTSSTGGTTITFKTAGTGAKIPTTVHLAGNYGQSITVNETGEISIA